MTTTTHQKYYEPHDSAWPIVGALALLLIGYGAASWISQLDQPEARRGPVILAAGALLLLVTLFGWFGKVIGESEARIYSKRVDVSFRWAMSSQYLLWTLGLVQILRYRRRSRSRLRDDDPRLWEKWSGIRLS